MKKESASTGLNAAQVIIQASDATESARATGDISSPDLPLTRALLLLEGL